MNQGDTLHPTVVTKRPVLSVKDKTRKGVGCRPVPSLVRNVLAE